MDDYSGSASKDSDVLGPPPSYDSVVYGTDSGAASGVMHTGSNIPPPGSGYPHPYTTYPPPPINDVNQPYTPYPGFYNQSQPGTAVIHPTTIVCANNQPPQNTGCRRAIILVVGFVFFFIVIIIAWRFSYR